MKGPRTPGGDIHRNFTALDGSIIHVASDFTINGDELGDLAASFNKMTGEVAGVQGRIVFQLELVALDNTTLAQHRARLPVVRNLTFPWLTARELPELLC